MVSCGQYRVMHFMHLSFQGISLYHNSETEWRLESFFFLFFFFYTWLGTQLVTLILGAHLETVLIV